MRMCALIVGLPQVVVVGVESRDGEPLRVHVEIPAAGQVCARCQTPARVKDRRRVELVDLPAFGRPARLVWRKHRMLCPNPVCGVGSWTAQCPQLAPARCAMTDRAGRWVTEQVGRFGRSVAEVARELGCDWHTVNDAVVAYGTPIVDDPARIGRVSALGVDEVLFVREGPWRRQFWATQFVDVRRGQLLDVVAGRAGSGPAGWLRDRPVDWREQVRFATLDLAGSYRSMLAAALPDARQVADPFHVVRLANHTLDECRRRVQNDTLGHRGRKDDPLYRCRRLLVMADERISDAGRVRLRGLLDAGDPHHEVRDAWHAKEIVRGIYAHTDKATAEGWVDDIARDFTDREMPVEVRRLGRTIKRWKTEILAWHDAQVTNGPTEAVNNLSKQIKRDAFGFRNFRHFRIRTLLYAGRPDWSRLATLTPR